MLMLIIALISVSMRYGLQEGDGELTARYFGYCFTLYFVAALLGALNYYLSRKYLPICLYYPLI